MQRLAVHRYPGTQDACLPVCVLLQVAQANVPVLDSATTASLPGRAQERMGEKDAVVEGFGWNNTLWALRHLHAPVLPHSPSMHEVHQILTLDCHSRGKQQ